MGKTITILDNSKYKKDFNKYFTIGDYMGDSHEIGNTELSDEVFKNIFDIINTIVLIVPDKENRIDGNLAHQISEDSGDSKSKIKDLLRSAKLSFHSRELHDSMENANCKSAIHYFKFEDYSEVVKFLEWEELDSEADLKVYTTLVGENPIHSDVEIKSEPEKIDLDLELPDVNLPEYPLSEYELRYLKEIYSRFLNGADQYIKPYALVASMWKTPPKDFQPEAIDNILLSHGSLIQPLGIYQVDPDSDVLKYIDLVIPTMREIIHENEGKPEISSEEIRLKLPELSVSTLLLSMNMIARMGKFNSGTSSGPDEMSLRIDSAICYKNISEFTNLEGFYKVLDDPTIGVNPLNDSDLFPIVENDQLGGLVVNDSTEWFEHAQSKIESRGHTIVWWSKLPSGTRSLGTLDKLEQTIKSKGFFDIYYCKNREAYYKARVVQFATESTYDQNKWKRDFPGMYVGDYSEFVDDSGRRLKRARIVCVANEIVRLKPEIPVSNFEFPPSISPPTRNNLQPFTEVKLPSAFSEVEEVAETKVIYKEAAPTFAISEKVEGVIGVKEYSKELSELLLNLNNESGLMVGLFGRWGRGKTFFWKEMKQYLNSKNTQPHFFFSEFHAWKYQDTPASWAYLYEEIVKSCIDNSDSYRILWTPIIKKNIFRLNANQLGYWPLIGFCLSFLFTTIWLIAIPLAFKLDLLTYVMHFVLSGFFSVAVYIWFYKVYSNYIPKAKDLFAKYSHIMSFKELLGFQSEIQEELIKILKASLPGLRLKRSLWGKKQLKRTKWAKRINAKRLKEYQERQRTLLFVDDIDRCSEDKIIQIIDSLKVMLEDSEISKRMVVLTAVDERVLKRAIKHKYYDLVERSCKETDENQNVLETLSREYMDKLFIAGMKLSTLSTTEKKKIFDAFSKDKGKINFRKVPIKMTRKTSVPKSEIPDLGSNVSTSEKIELEQIKPSSKSTTVFRNGSEEFEIEEWEYKYLLKSLENLTEATPRSIRIFYYRYLLAKRIMKHKISRSSLQKSWEDYSEKQIIPDLLIYFSSFKTPENLKELRKKIVDSEDEIISVDLFDTEYLIQQRLILELLHIIETVVPY